MNQKNPLFLTYFIRNPIASHPDKNDTAVPEYRTGSCKWSDIALISSTAAPNIAGVPSRNENRAASGRANRNNRPAIMVAPLLETPGMRAIICAKPIKMPSLILKSSSCRSECDFLSVHQSKRPTPASGAATMAGWCSFSSMILWNNNPTTPAGTEPRTSAGSKRSDPNERVPVVSRLVVARAIASQSW